MRYAWGRGEGTQQSFMQGGSTLESNPLPFYIPFLTKKGTPFIYLLQMDLYVLSVTRPLVSLALSI